MKKIITACFLLTYLAVYPQSSTQLEFVGSEEYGILTNFLYDPYVQNKIYASTSGRDAFGSHLMVSHDNGVNWEILYSFSGPKPLLIRYMKFTENYNALSFYEYYGGGPIERISIFDLTTNTITKQFTPPNNLSSPTIKSYSIYEGNSDIALIHTSIFWYHHTVFFTVDGGQNWSVVYDSDNHFNVGIENVLICPDDPQKFYLTRMNGPNSQGTEGGLWISENGGQTWNEKLSGIILGAIGVNPADADDIYVGSGFRIAHPHQDQALYRSLDGGDTWQVMPITFDQGWGFGSYDFITEIVHNPANPSTILVLEENEIIISKDNGLTWQSFVQPGTPDTADYWYGLGATFNPYNEDEVYIHDYSYPLHSLDGAQTLSVYKNNFYRSTGDVNVFVSQNEQHVYHGVQWGYIHKDMNTGIETATDVQPLNNEYIGGPPLIRMYIDPQIAGRTFSFEGNFMFGYHLSVSDDHNLTKNQIFNTTDPFLYELEVDPVNPNTIWAAVSDGNTQTDIIKIDFTNLNNIQYTAINVPVQGFTNGIAIHSTNPDIVLIAINHQIFKSIDGGNNWDLTTSGLNDLVSGDIIYSIEKNPLNANQFTITSDKGVFTTYDEAANWQQLTNIPLSMVKHSTETPGHIAGAKYSSSDTFLNFRLYYSANGGGSWEVVSPADLHYINSNSTAFWFFENTIDAYIATSDLGLVKYEIDMLALSTIDNLHPRNDKFVVFPNPASDVVNIQGDQEISKIRVYNFSGQIVFESDSTNKVDVTNFTPGIYIVQIETSTRTSQALKLVKK